MLRDYKLHVLRAFINLDVGAGIEIFQKTQKHVVFHTFKRRVTNSPTLMEVEQRFLISSIKVPAFHIF